MIEIGEKESFFFLSCCLIGKIKENENIIYLEKETEIET